MRFIIVTGMSGAGKSTALKMLEDMGFFCVDNLPVPLLGRFAEFVQTNKVSGDFSQVALGVDVRSRRSFEQIGKALNDLESRDVKFEILFLDASNDVLTKRYKETRRKHPLVGNGRVLPGILMEREMLKDIKNRADYVLDTSHVLTRELKIELEKIFVSDKKFNSLMVTVVSFGFKYGIPEDADLVFDVRFLPNPYDIEELRPQTGNDEPVSSYVMKYEQATVFLEKLTDMLTFLLPNYIDEGKHQLVVAIGCTGGKHRSVTLANELYKRLQQNDSIGLRLEHRDIEKDAKVKAK